MKPRHTISVMLDEDELKALQSVFESIQFPATQNSNFTKALPLVSRISAEFENALTDTGNEPFSKRKRLGNEVDQLKKVVERQKWQISGLLVQAEFSRQRSLLAGVNNTAIVANGLMNPDSIKIHCTRDGRGEDFDVKPRNIIAIKAEGKMKIIYLRNPVRPIRGGALRYYLEKKVGFEALLADLQKGFPMFFRISDGFVINLFDYDRTRPDTFVLREKPDDKLYEDIFEKGIDFAFKEKEYLEAINKIEEYENYAAQFKNSRDGLAVVGEQIEYFGTKYGKVD